MLGFINILHTHTYKKKSKEPSLSSLSLSLSMIHRQQHKAHIKYENPSSLQHHLSNTRTLSPPSNPFSSKHLTGDTGGAPTGARRTGGGSSQRSDTHNHTSEPSHQPPSSSSCATADRHHHCLVMA
ncbi:hypothetical protein HanPSC8_Chr04g0160621 [Helianthus annuus]|nr:hypothetical protein HanPSC8_Chr04g0160621 [Helianthus annuus]